MQDNDLLIGKMPVLPFLLRETLLILEANFRPMRPGGPNRNILILQHVLHYFISKYVWNVLFGRDAFEVVPKKIFTI